jgi:murein DD-endopeptidase MepM/ murein hydrolase activator NlpD
MMKGQFQFQRIFILVLFSFLSSFLSLSTAYSSEQNHKVIEGRMKEGDTFSDSLLRKRIPLQSVRLIVLKLKPHIDFRRMKGGDFQFIADEKGELVKFTFEAGPMEIYEIERNPYGEYAAKKKEVPLETYLVKVSGEIRYSLAQAMEKAGEEWFLATAFAEILAWDIDFSRDVRRGDRFKVVVEKLYKGDQFIQYGSIHALEYQSGNKIIRGIRFHERYYNAKGISLEKAFLRMPLRFTHISSGFNRKRKHPIMGGVYPHLGIDYAAPLGTPVWAVANGIVDSVGWVEGFGKQVVLRHPNGYVSYYSHLSRYGPGIQEEKRVEQKQIIGYVGSTGFSTGPHLDYRLSKNGQFIDSLKETFPQGEPVGQKDWEAFLKRREEIMVWLNEGAPFRRGLAGERGEMVEENETGFGNSSQKKRATGSENETR